MAESRDDRGYLVQPNVQEPVRNRYWFYKGKFDLDNYEVTEKCQIRKCIEDDETLTKEAKGNNIISSPINICDEVRDSASMDVVEDEELKEMIRYNEREQAMLVFSPTANESITFSCDDDSKFLKRGSSEKFESRGDNRISLVPRLDDADYMEMEDVDITTPNEQRSVSHSLVPSERTGLRTEDGDLVNGFESKPDIQNSTSQQDRYLDQINSLVTSEDEDDGLSKELRSLASAEDRLRKELFVASSNTNTERELNCDEQKEESKDGNNENRKESTFQEFLSDVIDYACRGDVFSCVSWESK